MFSHKWLAMKDSKVFSDFALPLPFVPFHYIIKVISKYQSKTCLASDQCFWENIFIPPCQWPSSLAISPPIHLNTMSVHRTVTKPQQNCLILFPLKGNISPLIVRIKHFSFILPVAQFFLSTFFFNCHLPPFYHPSKFKINLWEPIAQFGVFCRRPISGDLQLTGEVIWGNCKMNFKLTHQQQMKISLRY